MSAPIVHYRLLGGRIACGVRIGVRIAQGERVTLRPDLVTCPQCKSHEFMSARDILSAWRGDGR